MFMQSGRATANTTESATELEQKLVRMLTMRTITRIKRKGETLPNNGARVEESHTEIPIASLPIKEPSPIIDAIKRKVGQLTAFTAVPQSRIFSPSILMKFIRNNAKSGG